MITIPILVAFAGLAEPSLRVTASMPDSIVASKAIPITLTLETDEGVSLEDGGIPQPFLQIEIPEGVRLVGTELATYEQQSKREFLHFPYERLIESESEIEFEIVESPASDAVIALNVVAYASGGEEDEQTWFLRRRVELPIRAGATASSDTQATTSDWGVEEGVQIGEKAPMFVLPRADGTTLDLREFAKDRNVIVTTYRAFW